ncbi:lysophospholipid acyltransferase family protein [Andreprevotia chitinilytica]|uniref:lysophospholipid acyltransferase family protein n=1 Tax=Andreprevotia chitinilytica TaxID=396808 RepID=UPI000556E890|nr:lysophospholipid acyltransferase family protein [Andreprevotia chitinilytica]
MLVALCRPFAYLPLALMHAAGVLLGWLVWAVSPTYRRRLRANLMQSGLVQGGNYTQLLHSSIAAHGQGALELPAAWLRRPLDVADLVRERVGWAHVEAALAKPNPVIYVSPHLGGIEVCGIHLGWHSPRIFAALYRPPKLRWLEPLMLASRNRENGRAAPANAQGVRMLLKTLKQGQSIYILPDQAPGGGEGIWAPFFGKPAYTMTLLPRLARQFDATVLFCFAERLSWGRGYRLHIEPMQGEFTGDAVADATTMNRNLEALIAQAPAQYLWSYNRYKHPAGAPPLPEDVA